MFRQFITLLLVIALLGYGTSWAFSGHVLESADHAAGTHEHGQEMIDEEDCDHCCHAAAHMTGLTPPMPGLTHPDNEILRPVPGHLAFTHRSSLPRKPPRS